MKWRLTLLLPAIMAPAALAQQSPPGDSLLALPPAVATQAPVGPPTVSCCWTDTATDRLSGNHNFVNFINWLSNPLTNIDPRAVTAIYPLFGSQWTSNSAPIPNADTQVYGPAMTIALSDRFAMGVNQGGYGAAHLSRNPVERDRLIQLDPLGRFRDVEAGGERKGWLNIGGFFQYTLIEDVENQFLFTGGIRWIAPCGSHEIFQGHGPLELAPYVTLGKEIGKFHILATTGYEFPAGPGDDNIQFVHANFHIDRQICGWFYPVFEVNGSYVTKSVGVDLRTRNGFIDFGNFEATGNVVTLAVGVNAVLIRERLELGAFYATVVASQRDFGADGLGVKMTLRY